MADLTKNYQKYRWFYTSSGKLVIGGKNAEQNDELLKGIKSGNSAYMAAHTAEPGSPFAVILSNPEKLTKKDLAETAIFTASYSRAWRACKKQAAVDFFLSTGLYKDNAMSTGTWGVRKRLARVIAPLRLTLIKQQGILRAVPYSGASDFVLVPGSISKQDLILKLEFAFRDSPGILLSSLPSGGFQVIKTSVKKSKKEKKGKR